MDAEWHFWAGLANMGRGWCTMDCKRVCIDRHACDAIKSQCGGYEERVRKVAEETLESMQIWEGFMGEMLKEAESCGA